MSIIFYVLDDSMLLLTPAAQERSPLGAGNRAECVFRKYTRKKAIENPFTFRAQRD